MRSFSGKLAIIFTALMLCGIGASTTRAAVLGTYTFDGYPGNQVSQPISSALPGLSFTNLVRGPGLTSFPGANSFASTGFERNFDLNDYMGFTLSPTSGGTLNITGIDFTYRRAGAGPGKYSVRTSLDGFATNIVAGTFVADTVNHRLNLSFGSAVTGVTTPVTVRLYAWQRPVAASGDFRLGNYSAFPSAGPNNFVVNGSISSVVPEAGTIALIAPALGVLGLVAVRRRKAA